VAEGYELKEEQVAMALEPLGLHQFAIGFYNVSDSAQYSKRECFDRSPITSTDYE
jgi:hypothetical protein